MAGTRKSFDKTGMSSSSAVDVIGGRLLYRNKDQAFGLRDVNLTVRKETIYALLGPSGCGKTTLLSTLVGLKTLQAGRVKVFGHEVGVKGSGVPGPWIGYMPQDICLYSELTSEETLRYFASLHRISGPQMLERTKFLLDLLDLPRGRLTSGLSDGQQRLLSLATALVHDPPLLLLDEPTVGVDPLLRKTIWSHLCHLSRELGKTVLITTHYIEEAGRADVVGLMRDGKILVEDEPRFLKERYRVPTLEDVFLQFGLKEEEDEEEIEENGEDSPSKSEGGQTARAESVLAEAGGVLNQGFEGENQPIGVPRGEKLEGIEIPSTSRVTDDSERESVVQYRHVSASLDKPLPKLNKSFKDFYAIILAVILKNLQIIRRNFVFLIIAFASPLSNVLLAHLLLGGDPFGISVALVNDEYPDIVSKTLIKHLDKRTLDLTAVDSLDEAKRLLGTARVQAVLHIGPDFTRSLLRRIRQGLSADNATVEGSTLRIYSYFVNLEVDRTILNTVFDAYAKMADGAVQNLAVEPGVSKSPLFEKPILGSEKPVFSEYLVHNMLPDSLFMMSMALSALVFVGERSSGLFDRSRVSGVTPLQSLITFVQIVLLLVFVLSFRMEVKGSYFLLVFLFYQASYFGMAIGIFISAVTKTPHAALLITVLIYWSSGSFTGIMWPVESFPHIIRELAQGHPGNWNYRAVSKVMVNGSDLSHVAIWKSVLLSIGWTSLLLVSAVFLFKRSL